MLLIMSDKELMERKTTLLRKLKVYEDKTRDMHIELDKMYVKWRSMKEDPVARAAYHKEIFKLKNILTFGPYDKEMAILRSEIAQVNEMLYPEEVFRGSVYDDDRSIYDLFEESGIIHGVKL